MRRSANSPLADDQRHFAHLDLLKFQKFLCKDAPRRVYLDAGSWMLCIGGENISYEEMSILDLEKLGIKKMRGQTVYTIYSAYCCCRKHFDEGGVCDGVDEDDEDYDDLPYFTKTISVNFGDVMLEGKQLDDFYFPRDFHDRVVTNDEHSVDRDVDEIGEGLKHVFDCGRAGLITFTPTTFGLGGMFEHPILSHGQTLDAFNVGTFVIEKKDFRVVRQAVADMFVKYDAVVKASIAASKPQ